MLSNLSRLNQLLLDLVQADLFVANSHADDQNADSRDNLSHSDALAKNENVAEHGVDNVDEADEGYEAGVATLERNSLTHDTYGIQGCSAEQNNVIEGAEVEHVQRTVR